MSDDTAAARPDLTARDRAPLRPAAMTNVYEVGAAVSQAVQRVGERLPDLTVEQIALALSMVLQEALQERLRVAASAQARP